MLDQIKQKIIDILQNNELYISSTIDDENILIFESWGQRNDVSKEIFESLTVAEKDFLENEECLSLGEKVDIDVFERILECEVSFDDEYLTCDSCNKYVHQYNYYIPQFYFGSHWIECVNCVRDDPETCIKYLINNPNIANNLLPEKQFEEEMDKRGFKRHSKNYTSGFEYRNDSPSKIFDEFKHENGVIFNVDSSSSFYVDFSVYLKPFESEEN
jgi:hypothetical protein